MSNGRRLEYDKGPSLDDDPRDTDASAESADEASSRKQPTGRSRRLVVDVAPWKAGLVSGIGAFAAVFLVSYQLVAAVFASGMFARVENEPSQWLITGFTVTGSHGATIEEGGETVRGAFAPTGMLTSHVSALVPIVVLGVVGYLLVRHLRLERLRDAGVLLGTLTASYVALTVAVGTITEWSPRETEPAPGEVGPEPETLSVAVDASMVLSVTVSVVLLVGLGAVLAALPRLIENAPVETTTERTS